MATLRFKDMRPVLLVLLGILFVCQAPVMADPHALPDNVFANEPPDSSIFCWWRPQVVWDEQKAVRIERKFTELDANSLTVDKCRKAFGEDWTSSFLFPIAATHGSKGVAVLKVCLSEYAGGMQLDDRWLLIVASLGRMAEPEALKSLEGQYRRIIKEGLLAPTVKKVKGHTIRVNPPPIARCVMDAIVSCRVRLGGITTEDIASLSRQMPENEKGDSLVWPWALEWTTQVWGSQRSMALSLEGLRQSPDARLYSCIEYEGTSDAVRAISLYLTYGMMTTIKDLFVASGAECEKIREFLAVQYCNSLVEEAHIRHGLYTLPDKAAVDALLKHDSRSRQMNVLCKVLLSCPSTPTKGEFSDFLKSHAAMVEDRDIGLVKTYLGQLLDPNDQEYRAMSQIHNRSKVKPLPAGVHMLGLARAPIGHVEVKKD